MTALPGAADFVPDRSRTGTSTAAKADRGISRERRRATPEGCPVHTVGESRAARLGHVDPGAGAHPVIDKISPAGRSPLCRATAVYRHDLSRFPGRIAVRVLGNQRLQRAGSKSTSDSRRRQMAQGSLQCYGAAPGCVRQGGTGQQAGRQVPAGRPHRPRTSRAPPARVECRHDRRGRARSAETCPTVYPSGGATGRMSLRSRECRLSKVRHLFLCNWEWVWS